MGNPQSPPFTYSWLPATLICPEEKPVAVSVSKAVCTSPGSPRPLQAQRAAGARPPPGRSGDTAPEGPTLSWLGTGRKTLSLSVLLGLVPPEPGLGHQEGRGPGPLGAGPPGKRATLPPGREAAGQAGAALDCHQSLGPMSPLPAHPRGGGPAPRCAPRARQVPGPGSRACTHTGGGGAGSSWPCLTSPSCGTWGH